MQHYTTSLQEWFPLTCAGNFLLYKSRFHLLSLKILWSHSPLMANQLLSLADVCLASLTLIKLAVLNPSNCISHCDLRFTSRTMRGLWHTEAEIPQMPPTGHFFTKNMRGGRHSAAATCWWCSSSSCWLGANTHAIHSFDNPALATRKESLERGFAEQGWATLGYLRASAGQVGGRL